MVSHASPPSYRKRFTCLPLPPSVWHDARSSIRGATGAGAFGVMGGWLALCNARPRLFFNARTGIAGIGGVLRVYVQ